MVRIEICGGITSGKTTLAGVLQTKVSTVLFEDFKSIPFWKKFYEDPDRYGFEAELSFLIHHYSRIRDVLANNTLAVCDFALVQDLAYAEVNLSPARVRAFQSLYRHLLNEVGEPDILVHLRCSAEEELERIRRRNRDVEKDIRVSYLDSLNVAIDKYVASFSSSVRIVAIDSEANDFAHDREIQRKMQRLVLAKKLAPNQKA